MLYIYRTVDNKLTCPQQIEKDCWINLVNPSEAELRLVSEQTGLDYDFLKDPLDSDELPRVEVDDDEEQALVIIHAPYILDEDVYYDTLPLGIVMNDDYVVTVCLRDLELYEEAVASRIRGLATFKKTRLLFHVINRKTNLFIRYLRDINRRTEYTEDELSRTMKNKELLYLLNMQKSLVYFSTSLRYNAKVMNRLIRGKVVKMYEEDEDLLEDVITDNNQAIEMAVIYADTMKSTMDAFSSMISNNLSMTMKLLTAITIIIAIPTMISGFFGMNVDIPFDGLGLGGFFLILGLCLLVCIGSIWWLKRKDMF